MAPLKPGWWVGRCKQAVVFLCIIRGSNCTGEWVDLRQLDLFQLCHVVQQNQFPICCLVLFGTAHVTSLSDYVTHPDVQLFF